MVGVNTCADISVSSDGCDQEKVYITFHINGSEDSRSFLTLSFWTHELQALQAVLTAVSVSASQLSEISIALNGITVEEIRGQRAQRVEYELAADEIV